MLSSFPSPVLAVTVDAVKDLEEGREGLSALWHLFTKCKESVQDGPRLENMSWRLWYRELLVIHPQEQTKPPQSAPVDSTLRTQPKPSHSNLPSASNRSRSSSSDRRNSSTSLSQFICEILPETQTLARCSVQASLPTQSDDLPVLSLPTPETETASIALDFKTLSSAKQSPTSTTSHSNKFPRVVIVNPTPNNLTPHPTPPSTPDTGALHLMPSKFVLPSNVPKPAQTSSETVSIVETSPSATLVPTIPQQSSPAPDLTDAQLRQSTVSKSLDTSVDAQSSKKSTEDTLKPSDRRFFLPQSPDEVDSPERADGPSIVSKANSEPTGSATSSQSEVIHQANIKPHKPYNQQARIKGKEVVRHTNAHVRHVGGARPARPTLHHRKTHHGVVEPRAQPAHPTGKKAVFDVGSASSTASKNQPSGQRSKGQAKAVVAGMTTHRAPSLARDKSRDSAARAQAQGLNPRLNRKVIVASTSEYETETDSDDEYDSVASDDTSADNVVNKPIATNSRRTKSQPEVSEAEAIRLREAAMEARRQRDLFTKAPKRSYSHIVEENRSKSGLLSQLLNPDPAIFPDSHPYHSQRTRSQGATGTTSAQDLRAMQQQYRPPQVNKSSAALPVAAQVTTTGEVRSLSENLHPSQSSNSGYQRKGRPQGMEEDSDSESDNPNDGILMNSSLAEKKLAALAQRRSPASRAQGSTSTTATKPQRRTSEDGRASRAMPPPPLSPVTPIPFGHPYNLPPPTAPSTPRTTRRLMLQTEMSESLRRNLLWERQVSKANINGPTAGRRSQTRPESESTGVRNGTQNPTQHTASGIKRHSSGGVLGGVQGLQPLTSMASIAAGGILNDGKDQETQRREERKLKLARNRSWASDFHQAGW